MSAPDLQSKVAVARELIKAAREEMGVDLSPELIAMAAGGGEQVGMFTRLKQAAQYVVTGVTGGTWMSPFQPIRPQVEDPEQGAIGRQFDFPVGYNTNIQPRAYDGVSFATLRGLADGYDLMRGAIETCKDQIESFSWEVVPVDDKAEPSKFNDEIRRASDFLTYPDKEHNWNQWLRIFLEDLLVLDAVTIFPQTDRGGGLYSFDIIDATTIKRVIDEYGRTPMPPSPAYQQVLKGVPAVNYTRNDLVYIMRNPRSNRLYGLGPVEQVIMTVSIAMRRQISQLQFYTEGNVPEALVSTPKEWSAKQVAQFQLWWDSMMAGNTAQRRRMKFVPSLGDGKIIFPKEQVLKDDYDEWLARIICWMFSIPPNALIKQMNRASAQDITESAKTEGQLPRMRFIASQVNALLRAYLGIRNVEFRWKFDRELDPLTAAKVDQIYVTVKALTPDEIRTDRLSKPPLTPEQRAEAFPQPPAPGTVEPDDEGDDALGKPEKATPQDNDVEKGGGRGQLGKPLQRAWRRGAASLNKAGKPRQPPALTRVRLRVTAETPSVLRAIEPVFRRARAAVADQAAREYAKVKPADVTKLAKGWQEDLVIKILNELHVEDVSVDVVRAMTPMLRSMFKSAGIEAVAQVGVEIDDAIVKQLDRQAREYARTRGAELVTGLTQTTRERLRGVVTDAVDKGWSTGKFRNEIMDSVAFDDARSEMIARTELAKAHVDGNITGWRDTGQVEGKRSILGDLHDKLDVCDDCVDVGTVGLDDDFVDGLQAPPYHPNCLCDLLPVLTGEEDEGDAQ